jgi:orotate phosphoribosyltransferase
MQELQRDFISYAIHCGVLRFGEFTLKSGRQSPYFFNTGLFDTGARLAKLGEFYAQAYLQAGIRADVLYGPAYKGIPLVSTASIALARASGQEVPFAFNRKEAKDHGEGGVLVGAPLQGNVLILDDVITAGTSVRESVEIIRNAGAEPCGVLIALDRQEKGKGEASAIEEVVENYAIPVYTIITLASIIEFLETFGQSAQLAAILRYREQHGIHGNYSVFNVE